MSSIKDLTKAGSGKEGGVSLMIIKGRGGKRFKLSSEGRSLAEACHLLCHDSHRIDASNTDDAQTNVCSCSRCPQAQPNSVFDNFFVQDSLGRLYNTNGKPKAPATTSAASTAEDSESDDVDDDVSATRCQRRRVDSSLTSQSPATVDTASKLSPAKGGSRATAAWIDDLSDSDCDDELAGWDVASSPDVDEADEGRNDWTAPNVVATASAPSTSSTSALPMASRAVAIASYAPASSGSRSGRTLFDGRSDEHNVTPKQQDESEPEEDEQDESQTLPLSDDECPDHLVGNEDVTLTLPNIHDLDSTLKLAHKYGGTGSSSPQEYLVASPAATPARTAQSLAQGGGATWSVCHSLMFFVFFFYVFVVTR